MRWRIGVLLLGVFVWFVPAPALAHWDCTDESDWSDPVGVVYLYDVEGETWVYLEYNTYPGLQPHSCFDDNGDLYTQDKLVQKL